jgi:hypothetical protein
MSKLLILSARFCKKGVGVDGSIAMVGNNSTLHPSAVKRSLRRLF